MTPKKKIKKKSALLPSRNSASVVSFTFDFWIRFSRYVIVVFGQKVGLEKGFRRKVVCKAAGRGGEERKVFFLLLYLFSRFYWQATGNKQTVVGKKKKNKKLVDK